MALIARVLTTMILALGVCALAQDNNPGANLPGASNLTSDDTTLKPAPDFNLKDLGGKTVRLSDFKGKVLIVNFWATWCGPCRAEIPSLIKLRNQYHDRGLEIVGISLDDDGAEPVAGFAKQFKINYPIVIGSLADVNAYGSFDSIPTTFIVDRQGKIRSSHLGMVSFGEIEDHIKALL